MAQSEVRKTRDAFVRHSLGCVCGYVVEAGLVAAGLHRGGLEVEPRACINDEFDAFVSQTTDQRVRRRAGTCVEAEELVIKALPMCLAGIVRHVRVRAHGVIMLLSIWITVVTLA